MNDYDEQLERIAVALEKIGKQAEFLTNLLVSGEGVGISETFFIFSLELRDLSCG